MRAGDRDRQRVVELLGKHFGEGRLTVEEFDERVVSANAAVYLDQLPALTADLPADQPEARHRPARRQGFPPVLVLLLAVFVAWSLTAAVVYGAPPIFALILLFLILRHRRCSRRW
jgi:hypothetical protein